MTIYLTQLMSHIVPMMVPAGSPIFFLREHKTHSRRIFKGAAISTKKKN